MPRTETWMMDHWKFAWNEDSEERYKDISLPHDWAINAPFNKDMEQGEQQGFRDRWGIGYYKRACFLEEKKTGYKYYIFFGGIYENSTVYVNGKEAGGRKYGYSSFKLDITDFLQEGNNTIFVVVRNTQSPADRWYSGCGIYRTVKIIEVEENHLEEDDIVVTTSLHGEDATIKITTGVLKPVNVTITDGGDTYKVNTSTGGCEIVIPKARLWSHKEPNLYRLTLSLMNGEHISDTVSMRIGLREIRMIPGKGMFVNGEKVVLKGVCLHQDVGCRGIAAKKEIYRARLLNLKEMGCNAIRAAHHIFSVEFLDLCDEMGFYVYEEAFDKWTGGLYGRYFKMEWRKDLACMVKRDRNHACIFIWGVGNEVENQAHPSMLRILKMLRDHVLAMDPTRPVTYAMNPHFKRERNVDLSKIKDIQKFVDETDDNEIHDNGERIECIKKIADIVDIVSCNYQEQWYDLIHKEMPDKLILGTEIYQFFQGDENQMQNFTCESPSLIPFKKDYVIGGFIWTGFDYLGESMGYPAKGWTCAPIRTNGIRRPSFYILQSYWCDTPVVHFSVMDYSLADEGGKAHWDIPMYADHWHFPQFRRTVIPYLIASNCEEVRLYLNGKRYFIKEPSQYENRLITGFLPWQSGKVVAEGYRNGEKVCEHVTVTPGFAVRLEFVNTEIEVAGREGYELLLNVRAKDEDGNPVFRENALVNFRVEGNAEILAVDNGNLMGNEPYGENSIHLYRGVAGVQIRLFGGKGRALVYADAAGMIGGKMEIRIR